MNDKPLTYGLETDSATATFAFGQSLGHCLIAGQILALHGDLGAGKTVITQGIALGLGINARVTSPTFTLVSEYERPNGEQLIHIDCYRLGSPTQEDGSLEATFFGLDEIVDRTDAIVIIEWAERVATLLPPDHLQITLTYDRVTPEKRHIELVAHGTVSARTIERLQRGMG
jgi:tRNA threonylcarbamoyladenosine biosynthesis protein TsaE